MKYCRECGEEVEEADVYCWNCGNSLESQSDDRPVEERAEEWWSLVERLIDREVENIGENTELSVPPALLDKFTYAYRLYIIGLMKGRLQMAILSTADDHDDYDPYEIDLSPVYERIADSVDEREDDIRSQLEEPAPETD